MARDRAVSGGSSVSLSGVFKHFHTDAGPVHAVNGIGLEVAPGASVAITGPSGCGKSTLLSLIGALELPSSGRVQIDDIAVSELDETERAAIRRELIGFVFQSDNLQPFLTAVENVSLQLALSGSDTEYERSLTLLGALGLAGAAGKFPDQLSGGERQRVAVARALVHRPGLILADEPTGALDVDNSSLVADLLREAQAEVGATLIVITHDPTVAAGLDRQLALADGRLVADSAGPSSEAVNAASLAGEVSEGA